jgi:flagellar protein FlbD
MHAGIHETDSLMIQLTRLNGTPFAVNADLIERVETAPDTVVSMVDGRKYIVAESHDQVIERVVGYRASILVAADRLQRNEQVSVESSPGDRRLRLVTTAPSIGDENREG